jgi:tight adherence protein B
MTTVIFICTFAAVALGLVTVGQRMWGRRRIHELLEKRTGSDQRSTAVQRVSLAQRWEQNVKRAGLDWTLRSYLTVLLGGVMIGFLLRLSDSGSVGLLVIVGAAAGPWLMVEYRKRVRARQFSDQLPAALTLAANTIRAGGTMLQAAKAIAKGMPEPIKGEFDLLERALRLKVPLSDALEKVNERIGVREFEAVIIACRIAGQAGADLDHLLESIGKEIVQERQFREAMRAASSEARSTAQMVTCFPFVLAGGVLYLDASYFDMYVKSVTGHILLGLFLTVMGIGWFFIYRLADVRNW